MAKTITSANSVFSISADGVYGSPQVLEGYAADDSFATEALEKANTVMGLDGHLSAGYVFNPFVQTITLMPDSPSISVFENIQAAEDANREVIELTGNIQYPSTGKQFQLTRGFLTSTKTMADNKKVQHAQTFQITWEKIVPSDLGTF